MFAPQLSPWLKKRMNELVKGCQGLGEGQKKARVHSFKAPHNHYLCLACIAPVPVCMWGVLGLKGFTAWPLYFNFILSTEDKSRVGKRKKTPWRLNVWYCMSAPLSFMGLCFCVMNNWIFQFFLRYVTHLTTIHLLDKPCYQCWYQLNIGGPV